MRLQAVSNCYILCINVKMVDTFAVKYPFWICAINLKKYVHVFLMTSRSQAVIWDYSRPKALKRWESITQSTGLLGPLPKAIGDEVTENPFIWHIMLSDKGTPVRFCWIPSHCGIERHESVDLLKQDTLDQDIEPLVTVHYADRKPLVNSYIHQWFQIKWDVTVHDRANEVVITWPRIGHAKATKSHILSRGYPNTCHPCV